MLPDEFIISISDNGKGFSAAPPVAIEPGGGRTVAEGDGLGNMRHRIEGLGGRFEIFSRPGEGTQVRISLPMTQ